jgi:uncharacterized protein YecE (DUF72 family)
MVRRTARPAEPATIRIGTAGWSIPRTSRDRFPAEGTTLERYAAMLNAAEINSSFYRPHMPSTYERWAASVPDGFRFSVKLPKTISHTARLANSEPLLDAFLAECGALGHRLGCVLVQLAPKHTFDGDVARAFFTSLRERFSGAVAIEPRHPSWFEPEPDALLREMRVARVAADPPRDPRDGTPGGWSDLAYYRLHGSPRIYYSAYEENYLTALGTRLREHARAGHDVWCIFDNTTLGAAAANALDLALIAE